MTVKLAIKRGLDWTSSALDTRFEPSPNLTDSRPASHSLTQHSDSKHKGAPIATLFPTFVAK